MDKGFTYSVGTCEDCGKQRFTSRKKAKANAHMRHPGVKFTVYACGEYFHYGHTPYSIAKGYVSRGQFGRTA